MTDETKEKIEKEVKRLAGGLEEEFGVTCELTYETDYPPLYNDPKLTAKVAEYLNNANDKDIKEVKEFPAMAPSEEFAYYAKKIPFLFLLYCMYAKGGKGSLFQSSS